MVAIPSWVTFLVAGVVICFGLYRLYIARTSDAESLKKRKGMYGLPKRTHTLFGILYLILGAFLIASALGYNPFVQSQPEPTWIELPRNPDRPAGPAKAPGQPDQGNGSGPAGEESGPGHFFSARYRVAR
ncbi:MAG: DUF308 domain-containing protein [Proteobacteria bacterium]|nr:DUF308 domain-containing protein [Pseudomonadota bacterium]